MDPWYFTVAHSATKIKIRITSDDCCIYWKHRKHEKGNREKKPKDETFPFKEEQHSVTLWKENFEQLGSKNSRKVWIKIVNELNAQFSNNHTVHKCMRKMKYLIDKYKEKKDWNRKQSGGHLRKSPFYDKIDEILDCRDFVTFNNVKESASSSRASEGCSSSSSQSLPQVLAEDAENERKHCEKRGSKAADQVDLPKSSFWTKEQNKRVT